MITLDKSFPPGDAVAVAADGIVGTVTVTVCFDTVAGVGGVNGVGYRDAGLEDVSEDVDRDLDAGSGDDEFPSSTRDCITTTPMLLCRFSLFSCRRVLASDDT